MARSTFVRLTAALCAFALVSAVPAAAAEEKMTLEEVLKAHYDAIGGLDAWKKVDSFRAKGKMTMGPGMEAPFTMTLKRPMKLRLEFNVQGMTGVQAYDGETAWMIMPFQGNPAPEEMSGDQAKQLAEQADLDGALVDYEAKGHEVKLVGLEQMEGTPVYHLEVTMKDGDVRHHYLDAEVFLVIKQTGTSSFQGQEFEFESTIGDYKVIDGLVFPHSFESKPKGAPQGQVITIEQFELGVDVDDSVFEMPKAEAEAEAAE